MLIRLKIVIFIFLICIISNNTYAISFDATPRVIQLDSLIQEKNINNDLTQLDLLVLYENAISEKHPDSINIFKKLSILNAELEQPRDALLFTEKYIINTLDFSILNDSSFDSILGTEEYKVLKNKYMQNFNFLTFLYFYVALIGFFFAVIINFTKKAKKQARLFIGCFVAVHSLFILEFVLYMSNIQFQFPHTYLIASTVALLYGPLLYFYFRSVTQNYKLVKKDLLHFLPTVVLLIVLFPMYASSASDKIEMMLDINSTYKTYSVIIFITKISSLIIYGVLIWELQFKKNKKQTFKSSKPISRWMKSVYNIHVIYIVSYLVYGVSAVGFLGSYSNFIFHSQVGIMSFMVIYIAYMAYVQPNIFNNEHIPLAERVFLEKYKKSGLTDALSSELKENLIKLLVEDKIYKDSGLSLDTLSQKLTTTRHNTSQIINEHFSMNFFELINKFRIEESINILKEDVYGNLHIIDIAYEVGYNNKVTFNKAFKKATTLTPSEYINTLSKNNTY